MSETAPDKKSHVALRLEELRASLGMSKKQLADALEILPFTYYNYERKTALPLEFLQALWQKFSVSSNWLLHGYGQMFVAASNSACPVIQLPYVGLAAAAGPVLDFDNLDSHEMVDVPAYLMPKGRQQGLFVGRIEGDSMSELIPSGSLVLLRQESQALAGRVYVFQIGQQATIKKLSIDSSGVRFLYLDGSNRSIIPVDGEQWYCVAEFIAMIPS